MIPEPHPYDPDDPDDTGEDLSFLLPDRGQRRNWIDPVDPLEY